MSTSDANTITQKVSKAILPSIGGIAWFIILFLLWQVLVKQLDGSYRYLSAALVLISLYLGFRYLLSRFKIASWEILSMWQMATVPIFAAILGYFIALVNVAIQLDNAWLFIANQVNGKGISLALGVFSTVLAEELLFRFYLQPVLADRLQSHLAAALVATVLFTLIHTFNASASHQIFIFYSGLGLAACYFLTKNLAHVIGLHAYHNFFVFFADKTEQSKFAVSTVWDAFHVYYVWIVTITLILLFTIFKVTQQKRLHSK
jgi:membrane protease YdiL (CAAX protease family)